MKKLSLLIGLSTSFVIFSQVGINTENPKSTLDISAKRNSGGVLTDNSQTYGLQAPRLTRTDLTAITASYGLDQRGTLLYITDVTGGDALGQRINMKDIGYYYFDGGVWQTVKSNIGNSLNICNADFPLTSNRTMTLNGRNLNFTGSLQRTAWGSNGGLYQENLQSSGSAGIGLNGGAGTDLWIQQFLNDESRIQVEGNSTSLGLSTSGTVVSAPITFSTSSGGNALGSEKMRITGEGRAGINTSSPTERLDNNGITRLRELPLNGANNAINTTSGGTLSTSQDQTFTATRTLVADSNGVVGYVESVPTSTSSDATRFLGGTIYARFNTTSGGTLPFTRVIGGANGITYSVGSLSPSSSRGGINSVIGNSYTISNPSSGIFDIQFDANMTEIYGISVNIVDAYGTVAGTTNTNRSFKPRCPLRTNDNTQVSFISNSIIRIKTGDSNGTLANRSFTFLVTGK